MKGIPLLIFGFEKGNFFGENDIFDQRQKGVFWVVPVSSFSSCWGSSDEDF
jgi:hypothetical protein